ncbi:OprD family outer membrane porin [Sulfurovum sp. zt1-1]|uniref:OprD family outer membrane porin n=2 Tax=Sulfurovum zhangzhouensis TaxID=3019067 RepID=A0ABT7QYU1_9BACT|nr:OprD family outer membrane porin [Sulfurovum zhangzhouensis]
MSINIYAGEDMTPVDQANGENFSFIQQVDGYISTGYQKTDISEDSDYTDIALGGKLHIQTVAWNGISAGTSIYTTNSISKHEGYLSGAGIPFFDGSGNSYTILGEVYLQAVWGENAFKVGRQEIDTPFADTDDIGMVPNTFEAITWINKDFKDTTIILAQVQKMAGVDAEAPSEFTNINDNAGAQLIGVTFQGIEDLSLTSWYYHLNDFDIEDITYLEASYEGTFNTFSYALAAQYAALAYYSDADASVYGITGTLGFNPIGLSLGTAYNKSVNNAATNGFGGGPYFTSSEHLTLAEAGVDGDALMFVAEWDAGIIGLNNLTFTAAHLTLKDQNNIESTELDLIANYTFNDTLNMDIFYSDINDEINGNKLSNLRVFVNYTF